MIQWWGEGVEKWSAIVPPRIYSLLIGPYPEESCSLSLPLHSPGVCRPVSRVGVLIDPSRPAITRCSYCEE